jgi:hypothetical protein
MMKEALLMLVIFSAVVVGITSFYGDLNSRYGVTNVNISSLNNTQNINEKLNQTYQAATNTITPISELPIVGGLADATWSFITTSGKVIGLLADVPMLLLGMLNDIYGVFGSAMLPIPGWVTLMLFGLIFVGFIFFLLKFLRGGVV